MGFGKVNNLGSGKTVATTPVNTVSARKNASAAGFRHSGKEGDDGLGNSKPVILSQAAKQSGAASYNGVTEVTLQTAAIDVANIAKEQAKNTAKRKAAGVIIDACIEYMPKTRTEKVMDFVTIGGRVPFLSDFVVKRREETVTALMGSVVPVILAQAENPLLNGVAEALVLEATDRGTEAVISTAMDKIKDTLQVFSTEEAAA